MATDWHQSLRRHDPTKHWHLAAWRLYPRRLGHFTRNSKRGALDKDSGTDRQLLINQDFPASSPAGVFACFSAASATLSALFKNTKLRTSPITENGSKPKE